ncbi:DUF535 family protein [Plesiomonas shigelloides subsp. oncorhynchi]|nr:DUF535 family protein [Plesiomonas shigelloides]
MAIDALAAFVIALDGQQIIATSNQTHIYRSLRYRKTIQADYDSFGKRLPAKHSTPAITDWHCLCRAKHCKMW